MTTIYFVTKRNHLIYTGTDRKTADKVLHDNFGAVLHYSFDNHVPKAVEKTVNYGKRAILYS